MSKFNVGVDFSKPAKVYLEHKSLGVLEDENGNKGWLQIKSNKHPDLIKLENTAKQEAIVRQNNERRGRIENVNKDDIEDQTLNYLIEALVDWHIVNLAGMHIDAPCTPENKREILSDPDWAFLRQCLDIGIVEDKVFMPDSKLHSLDTQNENSSSESETQTAA